MDPVSQNSPEPIRRRVYFSGRVQGVGFRFTTEDIASRFQVAGFVRNLRDGRVEVVAEGIEAELDRFQDAIHSALRGYIKEANASDSSATGEFTSFRVAF